MTVPIPICFPIVRYRPTLVLPDGQASTLRELCVQAETVCKASGAWCDRRVGYQEGDEPAIEAEPNSTGAVLITVPRGLEPLDRARWMLAPMAYGVFDKVAKESIRGLPWTRLVRTREGVFRV